MTGQEHKIMLDNTIQLPFVALQEEKSNRIRGEKKLQLFYIKKKTGKRGRGRSRWWKVRG